MTDRKDDVADMIGRGELPPSMATYEHKESDGKGGECAHPECSEQLDEDYFCPGCGGYVCEDHDIGNPTMGNHKTSEHLVEPEWD